MEFENDFFFHQEDIYFCLCLAKNENNYFYGGELANQVEFQLLEQEKQSSSYLNFSAVFQFTEIISV